MNEKFNKYDFKISEVCNCPCHTEGINIMHCFPCCDLTSIKYFNEEDKLQVDKYINLKENLNSKITKE